MIRSLIEWSLNNPVVVILMAIAFVGIGIYSFENVNVESYPDPAPAIVEVYAQFPGASAEEVERMVTIPLEVTFAGMPGLKFIHSKSLFGLSDLKMNWNYGSQYTYEAARQEVINRMMIGSGGSQQPLPSGVVPTISPESPTGEIYRYVLTSPKDESGQSIYTLNDIKAMEDYTMEREFRTVPRVVDLTSYGGTIRRYEVQPDPHRLRQEGVTLVMLQNALANSNATVGGDYVLQGQIALTVRSVGLFGGGMDPANKVLGFTAQEVDEYLKNYLACEVIVGKTDSDSVKKRVRDTLSGQKTDPPLSAAERDYLQTVRRVRTATPGQKVDPPLSEKEKDQRKTIDRVWSSRITDTELSAAEQQLAQSVERLRERTQKGMAVLATLSSMWYLAPKRDLDPPMSDEERRDLKEITLRAAIRAGKVLRDEEFSRIREIRSLVITSVNNKPIRVEDVVEGGRVLKDHLGEIGAKGVVVKYQTRLGRVGYWKADSPRPPRSPLTLADVGHDDDDMVQCIVLMRKGEQTMPALRDVKKRVEEVNSPDYGRRLPGVEIEPYYDRSELLAVTTETVTENMLVGVLLVVVVLFMFVSNIRTALIVAINIPLALLFAFTMLFVRDKSANLLSIGAVDFGIIVDSSVIMVENIYRHLAAGNYRELTLKDRILKFVKEIDSALFFSTLIMVVAFVPLFTMSGAEGELFRPMAQTYAFSLAAALVLTMTLTPVLCMLFFKKFQPVRENLLFRFLKARYLFQLQIVLEAPLGDPDPHAVADRLHHDPDSQARPRVHARAGGGQLVDPQHGTAQPDARAQHRNGAAGAAHHGALPGGGLDRHAVRPAGRWDRHRRLREHRVLRAAAAAKGLGGRRQGCQDHRGNRGGLAERGRPLRDRGQSEERRDGQVIPPGEDEDQGGGRYRGFASPRKGTRGAVERDGVQGAGVSRSSPPRPRKRTGTWES